MQLGHDVFERSFVEARNVFHLSRAHTGKIVAVNGVTYDSDRLKEAVKGTKTNSAAIELLVKNGDRYSTVRIDYHEGLRYPHLERNAGVPARLDQILDPRN